MKTKWIYIFCMFLILHFVIPLKAQNPETGISFNKLQTITRDNAAKISLIMPTTWETKYVSMSPNAEMIAKVNANSDVSFSILIYDAKTGERISSMQGRMDSFKDLEWSPDNKRIAVVSGRLTGSGVEEQTLKTYTIAKGANPVFYIDGNRDAWYYNYVDLSLNLETNPVKVAWNPSSNLIAVAFYEKLEIYDGDNPDALFSQTVVGIKDVSWSEDGKFIIAKVMPNNVSIWGIQ
ncbi:MAG: hypothetical protein GC179_07595 [Anaerolineaceae bacterium]|nr:hypothetical protein [Anaerolineaceae bacterium]